MGLCKQGIVKSRKETKKCHVTWLIMLLFLLLFLLLIYFMFFIHTNIYEVAHVSLLFKTAFSFSHDFSIVIAMHKTCVWVMHWPAAYILYCIYVYQSPHDSRIKNKYHTFLMLLTSVSSSFVPKLVQTFLHIAKITVSICANIVFCLFRSGEICKYVFFQKL